MQSLLISRRPKARELMDFSCYLFISVPTPYTQKNTVLETNSRFKQTINCASILWNFGCYSRPRSPAHLDVLVKMFIRFSLNYSLNRITQSLQCSHCAFFFVLLKTIEYNASAIFCLKLKHLSCN